MSPLLLVDSPAVAHKIRAFGGSGWQVQVAPCALLDLPRNRLGVAVREGFNLSYQLPFRHQPTLKRLQKAVATAKAVYLALGDDLLTPLLSRRLGQLRMVMHSRHSADCCIVTGWVILNRHFPFYAIAFYSIMLGDVVYETQKQLNYRLPDRRSCGGLFQ